MSHVGTFPIVPDEAVTFGAIYSLICDTGNAFVASGIMDLSGDSVNITTSGSGNTITISLNNDIAIQGKLKAGDIDLMSGGLNIDTPGAGVTLGILGPQVISGTGDPRTVVMAPQGSLYLATDGSSSLSRAWINTDSGTSWTPIVTHS
jgi:hypothetical protein